jgi:uncharacterized protein DUF1835
VPGLDPNAVHLINGDLAAESLKQAINAANRLIVSRDILSCGPVRSFEDLQSWKDWRVGFWRDVLAHEPQVDLRPPQHGIWENRDRLLAAPRIYAWTATGNTDQFFVAFLFELMERLGADPAKVELVEFFRLPPAGRRVMQMGELDVSQLRMHPAPRELSMDEWLSYRSAWRTLTSGDPTRVAAFASDQPKASAPLKQAIGHLLRRYPDRASGLDFWDRILLGNVRARGPRAARVIGYTMGEHFDEGDLIGDRYFFWRLLSLGSSSLPAPLLSLSGDERTMQGTNVELTSFGEQVLDGKASAWPMNPIDYWAGGVHLSSAAGNVWFVEDGRPERA